MGGKGKGRGGREKGRGEGEGKGKGHTGSSFSPLRALTPGNHSLFNITPYLVLGKTSWIIQTLSTLY